MSPRAPLPVAVATLLLLASSGCAPSSAATGERAAPTNEVSVSSDQMTRSGVRIETVDEHDLDDTLLTSGRVTFEDARVAHVYSPVAGRITRIDAALGQHVKKGDALAMIESPDIGVASSDVGKAKADLVATERAFRRQGRLLAQGASSQSDYEAAEDTYHRAKAELDRATQRSRLMGTSGDVTQSFVLRASIEGNIVARSVTPGMEVQSQYSVGSALELFTIGTTDRVWVVSEVYEMDAQRVRTGSAIRVTGVALPSRTFGGTIDYVGEMLDPSLRTLKVRSSLENPDHALKPEMYVTVAISVDARRALAIPRTAVLRLGDQTVVFVDRGAAAGGAERFVRTPVVVDERSPAGLVPVKRGLAKGDRVVTSGAQILSSMM